MLQRLLHIVNLVALLLHTMFTGLVCCSILYNIAKFTIRGVHCMLCMLFTNILTKFIFNLCKLFVHVLDLLLGRISLIDQCKFIAVKLNGVLKCIIIFFMYILV